MNPLLLLAGQLVPTLMEVFAGRRGEDVRKAVTQVVTAVTGESDPVKAEEKIRQDPATAAQLTLALRQIDFEERKLLLDDAAKQREDRLNAEIEAHKARLAEIEAARRAEIEQREQDQRETADSRQMLIDLADKRPLVAYAPAALSYIVVLGFFIILGLFIFYKSHLETSQIPQLPEELRRVLPNLQREQIAALVQPRSDFVIQIINICVGALAAAFATVMSFWLGSSQSSRSKDMLVANLQQRSAASQERQVEEIRQTAMALGAARGAAPAAPPVPPEAAPTPRPPAVEPGSPPPAPPSSGGKPETKQTDPVRPAQPESILQELPRLMQAHRHFGDAVSWALTPAGVAIDGARAQGTQGEPKTVRRIWDSFGPLCAASAKQWGVPVELLVATIATESGGNPNAKREEPQINDVSVGLMQTLVSAAREVTGRTSLSADDLLDPRTSIDAGAAHIASRRGSTHFDPPLVAAAYNAGSLQREDIAANRWKLRCFPRGTGRHIDTFVAWFNDAMRVSDAEDWSRASGCPSFAAMMGVQGPAMVIASAVDPSSPDFPPRPAFRPIVSDQEREALFGKFRFVADPQPGNPEHIRILGDWARNNIEEVTIPIKKSAQFPHPFKMQFHKLGAEQLVALWLEWEQAGLLDRILTFDGAFVPRFQRKSTTKLSNHAFGSAFDVNAAQNPLGAEPAMMGHKGCVRELVAIANKHGFYWGGHFMTREDGMHFEVAKIL